MEILIASASIVVSLFTISQIALLRLRRNEAKRNAKTENATPTESTATERKRTATERKAEAERVRYLREEAQRLGVQFVHYSHN